MLLTDNKGAIFKPSVIQVPNTLFDNRKCCMITFFNQLINFCFFFLSIFIVKKVNFEELGLTGNNAFLQKHW